MDVRVLKRYLKHKQNYSKWKEEEEENGALQENAW
jgi:hypothetical protein